MANEVKGWFKEDALPEGGIEQVPNFVDEVECNVLCSGVFNKTADPTVNDDNTAGYCVGSLWANVSNDKEFVCVDCYTSAAVWKCITINGGHVVNLRAGDAILAHDVNFAPVETLTGANISRFVHAFDRATPEFIRHEFQVPVELDVEKNVVFTLSWKPRVHPGSSQNVVWEFESIAVAEGESWDQALVSKGTVVSGTKTTNNQITIVEKSVSVSSMGWAAGDLVVLRISRDADNANDTLDDAGTVTDDDALLFGVKIYVSLI